MVTFKPYPMIIDGLAHSLSTSQFIPVVRFKKFTSRNSEPNVFFHFKKTWLWNNFYRFRMRYTNVTYIQVSPNYHPTIRTTTTTMWMFADSSSHQGQLFILFQHFDNKKSYDFVRFRLQFISL